MPLTASPARNMKLEGSTISTSKDKSLNALRRCIYGNEWEYEHNGGTLARTLREACVAEDLPADAVGAGGVGAEVAAGGVAGAELGGGGRPLEHHRRGDALAVRQARLLVGEAVVAADDAAGAADPVDEAADVADLGGSGGGAQSGQCYKLCGRHPDLDSRQKPKASHPSSEWRSFPEV